MTCISYVLVFVLPVLLSLLCSAQGDRRLNIPGCPPFRCGPLGNIGFPFSNRTHRECGLLVVDNCTEPFPKIQLGKEGQWFNIKGISQDHTLQLHDRDFEEQGKTCSEKALKNLTLPISPFLSFNVPYKQSEFQCPLNYTIPTNFCLICNNSHYSYFRYKNLSDHFTSSLPGCSEINYQVNKTLTSVEYSNLFTVFFSVEVKVTDECYDCFLAGGKCQTDSKGKFNCSVTENGKSTWKLHLGIGLGAGGSVTLLIFIIWRCKKQKYTSTGPNSRNGFSDSSSTSELKMGSVYFEIPIFSYSELAKATDNFSDENVLGNGGFGTVYYAKLRDGREVAVKRLNEYSYRRVKQFMTEVEILTRLRHKNLVSIYGCTSQHSQQGLLLVYEYVPNGTVADHLRGDPAKMGSLAWPIRLKIAIETASALAYLHACDIIHRDVKTKNILLDSNFGVKVADFGLSRIFPADVTHVSTAPQGSPGYVDPEYYHCYQLTDRSDVYSFGVVLVELISSLPPVDKRRKRHEINLGNFAVNRIGKRLIEELVDPSLGYQWDEQVRRMITSVAELAFLCLQQKKEMRPPMDVVLDELKRIESEKWTLEDVKDEKDDSDVLKGMQIPPDCDNLALLKHKKAASCPISVAAKWVSCNTALHVGY